MRRPCFSSRNLPLFRVHWQYSIQQCCKPRKGLLKYNLLTNGIFNSFLKTGKVFHDLSHVSVSAIISMLLSTMQSSKAIALFLTDLALKGVNKKRYLHMCYIQLYQRKNNFTFGQSKTTKILTQWSIIVNTNRNYIA